VRRAFRRRLRSASLLFSPHVSAQTMRVEHTHAGSALLIVRPYREEVPRAYSKETRGKSLARPCSGHYALTADCRFPWQPIRQQGASLLIRSSDPPRLGVAHASRHNNTRVQTFHASIENASLVLPVEHRQFEPRPEGSLERRIFANGISLLAPCSSFSSNHPPQL